MYSKISDDLTDINSFMLTVIDKLLISGQVTGDKKNPTVRKIANLAGRFLYKILKWVARLSRHWSVVALNSIKGSYCFLQKDTKSPLLSIGWFQELIQT